MKKLIRPLWVNKPDLISQAVFMVCLFGACTGFLVAGQKAAAMATVLWAAVGYFNGCSHQIQAHLADSIEFKKLVVENIVNTVKQTMPDVDIHAEIMKTRPTTAREKLDAKLN